MPGIGSQPSAWCASTSVDRLPAGPQPRLHHLDLVVLRELDALREAPHGVAGGPLGDERGHLERLRVVRDHPLHELDVAVREPDAGEIGGRGGRDLPARLPGAPGCTMGACAWPAAGPNESSAAPTAAIRTRGAERV